MDSRSTWLLILLLVLASTAGTVLWLVFGREPRRRRAYRRIQHLLQQSAWNEALAAVRVLRQPGPLPPAWEGRARNAEGECLRQAGEAALTVKNYEQSRDHYVASARLLDLSEADARERVVSTMLSEVRRLFANDAKPAEIGALIDRVLKMQSPCPEASFWQGLCHVREGQPDRAIEVLRTAQEGAGRTCVDPSLYLGILLQRSGKASEALRYLSEANRQEPNCPFVSLQLGLGLVAVNGDPGLAARALQRALGPRGLPLWAGTPERAFVEGFPDPARSFVPRLARQHRFVCPVLGNDVAALARQGSLALSQAQYRLGNYQESANSCEALLKDAPPTLPVLRGLGLALARLQRYDEAFKHLRAAYEQEEPKNPFTAGYLALCGACGKPNRPEDKAANVAWAIRLLGKYHEAVSGGTPAEAQGMQPLSLPGSLRDWAALCSAVLAEARSAEVPVALEDQQQCCDILAAVDAADATAAAAYDALAATSLDALHPKHAWLYCRAAQQHDYRGRCDLDLFALTFRSRSEAQEFYARNSWDFAEVEFTYLERWADQNPGCFPPELGADCAGRAETLLLDRAQHLEEAGQTEAALASATLLLKLLPRLPRAFDRLAQLQYRQGNLDGAARLLADWQASHPRDHRPLLRLAVLQQQRGDFAGRTLALDGALALTQGTARADIAFLGARLALLARSASEGQADPSLALRASEDFIEVSRYLNMCLQAQPDHAQALTCLAAVRCLTGDRVGLTEQAPAMHRPEERDARFHYMAAVCDLAAADHASMLEAAQRAAADARLAVESRYLVGLAHLHLRNNEAAAAALQVTALVADSPSADHARYWLGRLGYAEAVYNHAVHWWQMVDAGRRTAWKLDEPFRGIVFLAALQAYGAGRFEQAAEQLRLAGRLGWRDKRLGPLLGLALFKEGQRRYYEALGSGAGTGNSKDSSDSLLPLDGVASNRVPHPVSSDHRPSPTLESAIGFLEQAAKVGLKDGGAAYLLALGYKRRGQVEEARSALARIDPPDAAVWLQRGLISLRDRQLAVAEQEFAQAWQHDDHSFAAGANLLLARLTLGRSADAAELAPAIVALAPNPEEWYLFTMLHAVLRNSNGNGAAADPVLQSMTANDEGRLLRLLRGLGHLDTVTLLLQALTAARPGSPALREAHFEATLLAAKRLLDRCEWSAAERLLAPLAKQSEAPPAALTTYYNLAGCATCLSQDFEGGVRLFQMALRLSGTDLSIHQNLAMAHEWLGQADKAEMHWNRYFDLIERRRAERPDYWMPLAYEGYLRLSSVHSDKERWPQALYYLEAATRLRPDHVETLERLFHLYHQCRRPDQARRVLQQLQQLRPGEPQFELYELDLIEINEMDDLERWLADVARILHRYPNDARVEDRAVIMVGNAVSFMSRLSDQLTEQLNRVMKQVRSLDNYQINWTAVHDVMRDLRREFQKLRRLASKTHTLATHAEHRRVLRELAEHLDRKIDYCRRWQGD